MKIERFLTYIRVEQARSPHTVEAYRRDLLQFEQFCRSSVAVGDSECIDFNKVTLKDIRSWMGTLSEAGISAASMRRKAQSLRAFYHWGMKVGLCSSNPAADLILAKLPKHLPQVIKEDEVESLIDQSLDYDPRAKFIVTMLYSLGLRQAELLSLTDADVNFAAKEVKVTGKRRKQRVLPLPDELIDEIKQWQQIRDERYPDLPYPKPLVAGRNGALSKNSLYKIVKDALQPVKSGRRSPHTLRHTFATAMLNDGCDLDAVREMLGHASLATTQIYTHLSWRELLDNYKGAHPRGESKK